MMRRNVTSGDRLNTWAMPGMLVFDAGGSETDDAELSDCTLLAITLATGVRIAHKTPIRKALFDAHALHIELRSMIITILSGVSVGFSAGKNTIEEEEEENTTQNPDMKFMKLGSRPDTFYSIEALRSVSSDVSSDLVIQVKGSRYMLHKRQIIQLPDFPGGIEAFELCAKFCYGITITLSAYNIVEVRCSAEYLQMTEDVEKGNLVYKVEVFFNSCILHGWKDTIVTLQSTKAFPLWSEDLGITSRCIESIASKISTNPSKVSLSHSHSRRVRDDISCNGAEIQRQRSTIKGWWAEDIAELSIDLYWRTMIAIKSGGKIPSNLIGEALQAYASRWLPNISAKVRANREAAASSSDSDSATEVTSKHRLLLESIVSLLPSEKGAASCSFLIKLLKAANILNASSSSKMELARRIALQLDEARVSDLLIPCSSHSSDTFYDVDMVQTILEQFMSQRQSPPTSPPRSKLGIERRRRPRSAEIGNLGFQEFQIHCDS
ncbi:BTB/POZ domain-containing protein [Hibiscus syriacus]|uniref:BTB/POZ domain-containing protein n=1 Tax=Hibiscus syriacus TaxID=106335 RepID=A0A6A3AUA2_HIBSY|nr:BTB/POZ domain-containing protein [Hibiscus syriacus]